MISSQTLAPQQELRGHFDMCTAVSVQGWATFDGGSVPELHILVNGAAVAKCRPDVFRPDVAKSYPDNPNAGFYHRFAQPLWGDNEIAVVDAAGRHINGSPCRLASISPQADFKRDFAGIQGWYDPKILEYLKVIDDNVGKSLSKRPICEIGVHEGKFLIGAHNTLDGTAALGIDLFSLQSRNIGHSGCGSLESTIANIGRYAVAPDRIELRERDSLDLSMTDMMTQLTSYKKFGLFSIDGGHEATHVFNDFQLAQEVTDQEGLILVDDFFSYDWPGVTEAIMKIFHFGTPKFAPFFLAANKLFLCGQSTRPQYYDVVSSRREQLAEISPTIPSEINMFGYPMLSCGP